MSDSKEKRKMEKDEIFDSYAKRRKSFTSLSTKLINEFYEDDKYEVIGRNRPNNSGYFIITRKKDNYEISISKDTTELDHLYIKTLKEEFNLSIINEKIARKMYKFFDFVKVRYGSDNLYGTKLYEYLLTAENDETLIVFSDELLSNGNIMIDWLCEMIETKRVGSLWILYDLLEEELIEEFNISYSEKKVFIKLFHKEEYVECELEGE